MPFTKGVSGNPAGRARPSATSSDATGDQRDPETGERRKDRLAAVLWERVLAGEIRAIEYVCDRLEGRPAQELRLRQQEPTLVFQIIDPRMPLPDPDQEVIEGEARELGAGAP